METNSVYKKINRAGLLGAALAAFAILMSSKCAFAANDYPQKPIRIVVSHVAGGMVDALGRIFSQRLSEALGQPITVENRAGSAGLIGAQLVAKAPADGYTLLMSTNAPLTTYPSLYKNTGYELKDFEPVALLGRGLVLVIVKSDSPIRTIADLVAEARRTPGGLSVASTGNGSSGHFATNELRRALGIPLTHVPYSGGVPGALSAATGDTHLGIIDLSASLPFLKDKRIRPIAILGSKRATSLPDVPTLNELGVKGLDMAAWMSVVAPKGTPKVVVNRLNAEINKILLDPEIRQRLLSLGVEPAGGMSPQEFDAFLRADAPRWDSWVKEAGLKME